MGGTIALLDFALAGLGIWLAKRLLAKKPAAPLPPGPKPLPIIGNVTDLPKTQEWLTFAGWGKQYGGIIYVDALGQPMMIVNDAKIAFEMLDKKSAIYSDRPVLIMASILTGWKNTLALSPYGHRFREYRKHLFRLMGSRANVEPQIDLIETQTHSFLKMTLAKPEAVSMNIRKSTGAIILYMVYGYKVKEETDELVALVDLATDQFSQMSAPGAYLVDVFPALQYMPTFITPFKQRAVAWKKTLCDMADLPFNLVKANMAKGTAESSFSSNLLDSKQLTPEEEDIVKWSAASLYGGGADTSVSSVYSFFLAMTLFPNVQKKAQAEIDAVIGHERLPTHADRERLPYVNALVTEVLRWNPVAPLGVPHRVMEDDIHDGYFIPKGTIIIANLWNMLHEPERYPNPLEFSPERFLDQNPQEDPRTMCFGFGRRICPGLQLADVSVWISCAMSLAVFDITKKLDENGIPIVPVPKYTDGTISHPEPFKCIIKPRSTKAEELILLEH
ncbi:cytochrome P450 [Stereum hirsutum FP-91666 SS1]|uniref:cytochrome P450 n=1 Tax=Stereum hirsutum (strain FP-91666) TaxID=721885 RepID=UPI0004449B9D|nr:cytochrome P450 [Stereum hirsutum FP-91666 SS1]EIM85531.1 cytochrome P450 [Stereum hirsutum FP-91666 SS1]